MYKLIIFVLCFVCVYCNKNKHEEYLLNKKNENKPCFWQGRNGTCLNNYKCRSAEDYVKNNQTSPICRDKDELPKICCLDCRAVEDTRKIIIDPDIGELVKMGPKAEEKCYEHLQTLDYPCKKAFKIKHKMVLDENKNCYEFDSKMEITKNETLLDNLEDHLFKYSPHWAYLGYGEDPSTADWLCGGSVISKNYVLTAAECVYPDVATGPVKFIALGVYKRWVSPSTWQHYNVKRAIPHPEFKPPSKYNDIALLETDREITFGLNVLPACLLTGNLMFVEPRIRTVVWSEGENSTLDHVRVLRHYNEDCSKFYPPQRTLKDGYNSTSQACFHRPRTSTGSCDGELGTPVEQTFKSCVKLMAGVVSFKRTCGDDDHGLLTLVHHYVPWIESVVWP